MTTYKVLQHFQHLSTLPTFPSSLQIGLEYIGEAAEAVDNPQAIPVHHLFRKHGNHLFNMSYYYLLLDLLSDLHVTIQLYLANN